METSLAGAQAYIDSHQEMVNPRFRPKAHLTGQVGWINDPNGFVFFKGEYHVFYQYHPYSSYWGPMHWGHAKSKDLVHWEQLPVALAPDQTYDKDGCFSGSAIVKDDKLYLMYTGNCYFGEGDARNEQVQNIAVSEDGIHFEKVAQNPVVTGDVLPEGLVRQDFRDPKVFEREGRYYTVIASRHSSEKGVVVLLGSDDLISWEFESIFLEGEDHQGTMWECPDYFEKDGKSYLIVSPMHYEKDDSDFANLFSTVLFTGQVDWEKKIFIPEKVQEIDHGQDFYAAQTMEDDQGRRIMIAWMQMWHRAMPAQDLEEGWACNLTFPRELMFEGGYLQQRPLSESLAQLDELVLDEELTSAVYGEFDLESSAMFELGNAQEHLTFGYDADKGLVYLDRSGLQYAMAGQEKEPVTRRTVAIKAHKIGVLIDTNSLELFINDGQETMTATCYIAGEQKLSQVR
ncbi:glycoside hydrolase family 32 protein [Streptococcus caprae]|uniref:Sucrose-6-phosphate hydrolase n=1 Tax=Streptococcus caprae TaxID=1640501 RepID=A0ABV8CWZ5_9STRE